MHEVLRNVFITRYLMIPFCKTTECSTALGKNCVIENTLVVGCKDKFQLIKN